MRHILRRLLFYACAVWVAITLDFFIPRLAPGDPVAGLVGKMSLKGYVTPAMEQTLSAEFGLNTHDSLLVQYFKYLNNLIEQDHRFIKRLTKPGMGFFSFETAWRTLQGYAMMNMIRKGQAQGVAKGDVRGQIALIAKLFRRVA